VKGISGKLVAWLISLSLLILLIVGAMEYHAGRQTIDRELNVTLNTISNRLIHNLRNPVYSFDVETIKDIVLGEFPNDDVFAIMVWTQERKQLLAGVSRSESRIIDIVKPPAGKNYFYRGYTISRESLISHTASNIGEVDIFLDRSIQEGRLVDSLVVNLTKIALVIVIILLMFELVVTRSLVRPLEAIYARIHKSGSSEDVLMDDNSSVGGFSELQELDETYQLMLQALRNRQKELSEREQNYREIFNATRDSILLLNAGNGEVVDVNQAMLKMFGYGSRDSFLKSDEKYNFFDLLGLTKEQVQEHMILAVKAGSHFFECRAKNNSGKPFWIEVSLLSSEIGGKNSVLAVIRDITKRKQDEEKLQHNQKVLEDRVKIRTRELENKNKELESFSYMVSHDLRAPLRSIDGFCQILNEDYAQVLDQQGKEYLNNVRSASQRLGVLIDDLLQLSRVSRHEINITSVDLSGLVNMTVEKLVLGTRKEYIDVTIQRDVIADGDEVLLQVVVDNLIGNAFKYTSNREYPKIEFGVMEGGSCNVYFVKDNGVGFDMSYVHKLFLPFQRLHGREFEGTGIGLASVKTVIDHHRGKVWAESVLGEGATFYFTLMNDDKIDKPVSQQS
jgi:PAS domain S-box-containing protein